MFKQNYRKMRDDFAFEANSLREAEIMLRRDGFTESADLVSAQALMYEKRRDYVAKFCGDDDD